GLGATHLFRKGIAGNGKVGEADRTTCRAEHRFQSNLISEDRMKLLIVSRYDCSARAINTIIKYVRAGKALGHEIALFSDPIGDMPDVPTSRDPEKFDYVMFVVYETPDFPDLPYLAHLLDGVPRERRIIVDCTGRYNETIQVERDFNHLEKMDNHMAWEWVDGFAAVAKTVVQPTLAPARADASG